MSNDPYRRLEQACEEYLKVAKELEDIICLFRELISEEKTILFQLLGKLDEEYFNGLNGAFPTVTQAHHR